MPNRLLPPASLTDWYAIIVGGATVQPDSEEGRPKGVGGLRVVDPHLLLEDFGGGLEDGAVDSGLAVSCTGM